MPLAAGPPLGLNLPPGPPPPPLFRLGPLAPGNSKSGLLASSISFRWAAGGGPGLLPPIPLPFPPGIGGLYPALGFHLGFTPRWETDVKFDRSDSAGEREPDWMSSYELLPSPRAWLRLLFEEAG